MPDYQEMYETLFRATEKSIRILIEAQQTCEELYLSAPEPPLISMPSPKEKSVDETRTDHHHRQRHSEK